MVLLHDVTMEIPSNEAMIRIYDESVNLNAAAVALLGLDSKTQVTFRKGDEKSPNGMPRVYIRKRGHDAYKLHPKGRCFRIHSKKLAESLCQLLQGKGSYRIEAENYVTDYDGTRCYSIFFKRF